MHRGFADLSLTTWVRRPAESLRSAIIYHARTDASIEAESSALPSRISGWAAGREKVRAGMLCYDIFHLEGVC
jgi:hypothetical protein